jgi:hypothetical protein
MLMRHPPRVWLPLGFTTIYRNGNGGAHSHSAQSQVVPSLTVSYEALAGEFLSLNNEICSPL